MAERKAGWLLRLLGPAAAAAAEAERRAWLAIAKCFWSCSPVRASCCSSAS